MEANDFIHYSVLKLVEKFTNIKASIHFEEINNTYYVEIKPINFFKESKELKQSRLSILDDFYNKGFNSVLVFIKEDSLLEIETFEVSFCGKDFFDINELLQFSIKDLKALNNEVKIQLEETMIEVVDDNYALAA